MIREKYSKKHNLGNLLKFSNYSTVELITWLCRLYILNISLIPHFLSISTAISFIKAISICPNCYPKGIINHNYIKVDLP